MVDNRRRPAIEIVDHHPRGIDAEVVVDRRQEIPCRAAALGDILPLAIGGPDHAAGLDAAAGPDVGIGPRPVVAARLFCAGRGAGGPLPCARRILDPWRAAKLTGDDDEDTLIEAPVVDVLDERRHRLVVGIGPVAEGVEDMVVDGMVVPVADPATQRSGELRGDDVDPRLDEPAAHEELLPPGVAAVAVAGRIVLTREVEGLLRAGVGEEGHRLGLELIEGLEVGLLFNRPLERIKLLAEGDAAVESGAVTPRGGADVGHREARLVWVAGDDERLVGVAEIGRPVVFQRRADADVARERVDARPLLGAEVVGHRHPVGVFRLWFVARVGIAREHLHRTGRMATGRLLH